MSSIETIINYISAASQSGALSHDSVVMVETPDWDDVAVTAIVLGLAPLLHWSLADTPSKRIPPIAKAKLSITYKAQAERNAGIAHQLQEILQASAAQNINVMVLKGALLAPTLYPDAALRPMNDIDLLFHPADLAKVGPLLESLGYAGKHKTADQGPGVTKHLSTYRRQGNEGTTPNPYLSASGDRMVEPHGSLEESWFGLKVDMTPGVWDRAVPITLHDQPAHRLSNEDQLLHLGIHYAFHFIMGASVFVQMYDVHCVTTAWQDILDWQKLIQLARAAKAQVFLYAGLFWANRFFHTPVPDHVFKTLADESPSGLVAYIHGFDANDILRRTQHPPLVTLSQRLRRGLVDRWETARWATSTGDKWKVWQTALALHKTDTAGLIKIPGLKKQPLEPSSEVQA